MVGPQRKCTIVDTGVRKPLDLKIHVPVESMVEPEQSRGAELDPLSRRSEATRKSIWPAIYPELLELVREHRSTIVFVNNRRGAERLALRLNELAAARGAGRPSARSPAPTTARWRARSALVVEELLKAGELPCLVATSCARARASTWAPSTSCCRSSRRSRSPRGLQRIGRAGHDVGDVSKGRIFPKFRADLLECAVVAQRMREGLIETTVVPRNPLDVLAQQIVAMAAAAERRRPVASTTSTRSSRAPTPTPSSRASCSRTCSTCSTAATRREEFGELRPRIVWDRVGRHDPRAQGRAPARGHQRRHDPRPRPVLASSCPTAAASASSTRRWSTRRGPARPSCSARRRGGSRRSGATA